jgi:hypothetical protein
VGERDTLEFVKSAASSETNKLVGTVDPTPVEEMEIPSHNYLLFYSLSPLAISYQTLAEQISLKLSTTILNTF